MGNLKWYKRDPDAALGGMMGLSLEERGAYNTVLDLIYASDDKLVDDDHFIAGWCQADVRVWKRIKAKLVEKGKLKSSDGLLRNLRATYEVKSASQLMEQKAESGRLGGLKSGAVRKQISDIGQAHPLADVQAHPQQNEKEKEKEKEKAEAARAREKDDFQAFETTLRAIKSVAQTPLATEPDISAMWFLVKGGMSLEADIIPAVEAIMAKPRREPIRSWRLVAKIVNQDVTAKASFNAPDSAKVASPLEWHTRLEWARKERKWWDGWGAPPNKLGCLVPGGFVLPSDGKDWGNHVPK